MRGKLSQRTVFTDRWDRDELKTARASSRELRAAQSLLAKAVPTGGPAMADLFFTLLKASPRLLSPAEIGPAYLVNRAVMALFMALPATAELRCLTVGDPVQATLACVTAERGLEELFGRLRRQLEDAQALAGLRDRLTAADRDVDRARQDLDKMVERWARAARQGKDDTELERQAAQLSDVLSGLELASIDLRDELDASTHALQASIDAQHGVLAVLGDRTISEATASARGLAHAADTWGLQPGCWQRLPTAERLELAKRLDTPQLLQAAELFGRLQPVVAQELSGEPAQGAGELHGIGRGADLARLAPVELLALRHPVLRRDFMHRFQEGALLQYDVREDRDTGGGGIVFCVDRSYSMLRGERERFSSALMLALLHLARDQGRAMHVLAFGAPGELEHMRFVEPADFTLSRVLDAAALFFGGGTCFEPAMALALRVLGEEHHHFGTTDADVVFVTDEDYRVAPELMTSYLEEMRRLGAKTWGIGAAERRPEPDGALSQMSEGHVWHVTDFLGPDGA